MKIINRSILLFIFSLFVINTSSIDWIAGKVSTDTLYAGQTNIIHMNAGFYDVNNANAWIMPYDYSEDLDKCPKCFKDTIWALDIEPYDDTVLTLTFDIPASAYPTNWQIGVYSGLEGSMHHHPMKMFTRTYIHTQPQNDTACLRGIATFDLFAISTIELYYTWFHNGEILHANRGVSELLIDNVEFSDTGMYYCFVEGLPGDTAYSDTVRLSLKEMPDLNTLPDGPTSVAYSGNPEGYQISHHPLVSGYDWILSPESAGVIENLLDSVIEITFSKDFNGTAGLFVERQLGSCPSLNSDTLWIEITGVPISQEICIVGLDEVTENCRIVWNKSDNPGAAFYNIYRESNEAGVFLKLAKITVDDPGVYVDSTSAPFIYPHSYRMTLTDNNGNESEPGKVHTTMLLSSSLGTNGKHNLSWNHYSGYPFLTYEIYHGSVKDSMKFLSDVASTVNSFSIQDPLPGMVYYQIVARRDGCSPVLKSDINYGETRSNIDQMIVSVGSIDQNSNLLEISPNPAMNKVIVRYTGNGKLSSEIYLLNLFGRTCGIYNLENNLAELDISGITPGIYLLKLNAENETMIRKLVIKR